VSPTIAPALRALIDIANIVVRDCRALAPLHWDANHLEKCRAALEQLADHAAELGAEELQAQALDLYVFLSALTEEPAIGEQHGSKLEQMLDMLARSALDATPQDDGTACIDLLGSAMGVPTGLAAQLERRGFRLRRLSSVAALANAVSEQVPAALLVEADLVAEACETLDELSRQHPQVGQIVVVGFGLGEPDARLQALLHGAEHFVESLDDTCLITRLLELVGQSSDDVYRVLVIDDIASTRKYLRAVLEQSGMRVQECATPHQALAQIERFQPDLLLVDLYMPGMDGITLTMSLRQHQELATLPIVFLSVEHSDETHFKAIQAGGDDFLTKPVRPRVLVAAVRSRIKRARSLRKQLPASVAAPLRGGQLRRGDFLAQLGAALRTAGDGWQVLMSVRIDQADALGKKLGMAGAHDLEHRLAARMSEELRADDACTLWLEFGFGVLARRNTREEIIQLAQRLCRVVAATPFVVQGESMHLTLSVGIALPPTGAAAGDPDRWFAAAFAGQSMAHRLGGDRYDGVLSRDHGDAPAERVLMIREWVKDAARGDNILVDFQPILPLHGRHAEQYAIVAKLRDYRAPLAGVLREEYLAQARAAGSMLMIDRMGLFAALEAIEDQRQRGRSTRVLAPVDLVSFDESQLRWFEAELRRHKDKASGLVLEIDADLLLERPELTQTMTRLEACGIVLALHDRSGSLSRLEQWLALPVELLRLPFAAVDGLPEAAFSELLAPWHRQQRELLVDRVDRLESVPPLWALGIGYLQGDALAAAGPRLDYDFTRSAA
jgi:PleD family two-component response regulator/EAL domain-containing protein (putative c-di-GMP-specific phosphodiesterase class I)